VLRRIHVDHGIERGASEQHVPDLFLGRVHQDAAALRGEGRGIAVHAHDVGMARHSPEAWEVTGLGMPAHRRSRAQLRECAKTADLG